MSIDNKEYFILYRKLINSGISKTDIHDQINNGFTIQEIYIQAIEDGFVP